MRMRFVPVLLSCLAAMVLSFVLGRRQQGSVAQTCPPVLSSSSPAVRQASPPASNAEFRWSQLEAADYPSFMANLRRAGCPEQTIRDLIIADICELYSREWKRKFLATKPHYWDPDYGMSPIQGEELQRAAAQVQAALVRNVRDLLGVELDKELEKFRAIGSTVLGPDLLLSDLLPSSQAARVGHALEKHQRATERAGKAGFLTAEGVAARRQAREELRRGLGEFLAPEQIAQIEYRCSEEAQQIRDQMAGFDLTEAEFRQLFARRTRALESFEASVAKAGANQPLTPDQVLRLSAEQELNEAALREVLGAERFAEYERSRDGRYQQLKEVAAEAGLSPAWVKALYENQRAIEENRRAIREDLSLSPEAREVRQREAEQASRQQLRLWLGEELARKLQPVLTSPR